MNVYGRVADVDIIGSGQSDLDARVTAEATAQGRTAKPDGNPASGSYFRSDHFPLAKRGVPMAYVDGGGAFRDEPITARDAARSEYGSRRYHQADDEWSPDWDLGGQVEDLQLIFNIGRDLANSRDWPQWMPGSEFGPARAPTANQRR
jgi:Zn-dependent M28 family amino/carboxypeptidase